MLCLFWHRNRKSCTKSRSYIWYNYSVTPPPPTQSFLATYYTFSHKMEWYCNKLNESQIHPRQIRFQLKINSLDWNSTHMEAFYFFILTKICSYHCIHNIQLGFFFHYNNSFLFSWQGYDLQRQRKWCLAPQSRFFHLFQGCQFINGGENHLSSSTQTIFFNQDMSWLDSNLREERHCYQFKPVI